MTKYFVDKTTGQYLGGFDGVPDEALPANRKEIPEPPAHGKDILKSDGSWDTSGRPVAPVDEIRLALVDTLKEVKSLAPAGKASMLQAHIDKLGG